MKSKINVPMLLTVFRILAVFMIWPLIMMNERWAKIAVFVIFALAALTDFLDGYLARKWKQTTVAGAHLDPLADKILVDGTMLCACLVNPSLLFIALIFIGRDVVVEVMRKVVRNRGADVPVSIIGKSKTALQMVGISLLLASRAWGLMPGTEWITGICGGFGTLAMLSAILVTLVSGVDYVVKGCRVLHKSNANKKTV